MWSEDSALSDPPPPRRPLPPPSSLVDPCVKSCLCRCPSNQHHSHDITPHSHIGLFPTSAIGQANWTTGIMSRPVVHSRVCKASQAMATARNVGSSKRWESERNVKPCMWGTGRRASRSNPSRWTWVKHMGSRPHSLTGRSSRPALQASPAVAISRPTQPRILTKNTTTPPEASSPALTFQQRYADIALHTSNSGRSIADGLSSNAQSCPLLRPSSVHLHHGDACQRQKAVIGPPSVLHTDTEIGDSAQQLYSVVCKCISALGLLLDFEWDVVLQCCCLCILCWSISCAGAQWQCTRFFSGDVGSWRVRWASWVGGIDCEKWGDDGGGGVGDGPRDSAGHAAENRPSHYGCSAPGARLAGDREPARASRPGSYRRFWLCEIRVSSSGSSPFSHVHSPCVVWLTASSSLFVCYIILKQIEDPYGSRV